MWQWSKFVAERAAAAGWAGWHSREPEPTILDTQDWRGNADRPSEGMAASADVLEIPGTIEVNRPGESDEPRTAPRPAAPEAPANPTRNLPLDLHQHSASPRGVFRWRR